MMWLDGLLVNCFWIFACFLKVWLVTMVALEFLKFGANLLPKSSNKSTKSDQGCPRGGQNRSKGVQNHPRGGFCLWGCPAKVPRMRSIKRRPTGRKSNANGSRNGITNQHIRDLFGVIFNMFAHRLLHEFFTGFVCAFGSDFSITSWIYLYIFSGIP